MLNALQDESDIIWAARGGYGSQAVVRNLRKSDLGTIVPNKVLIGFSDVTCLGLYLMTQGLHFFHGPVYYVTETSQVSSAKVGSSTSLKEVATLFLNPVETISYPVQSLNDADLSTLGDTKVLGGNLSVIQRNMFGVLKDVNWADALLFLEDTTETPQRSWEVLCGMFESGRFDGIKGIFFGDLPFEGDTDNLALFKEYTRKLDHYLKDRLDRSIPILWGQGFGHGTINRPIPMGTKTTIRFDKANNVWINIRWFT